MKVIIVGSGGVEVADIGDGVGDWDNRDVSFL